MARMFENLFRKSLENPRKYIDITSSFQNKLSYKAGSFSKLLIKTDNVDVILYPTQNSVMCKIESTNTECIDKISLVHEIVDDTLKITLSYNKKQLFSNIRMVLYIPEISAGKILSNSADVSLQKCKLGKILIESENGDISVSDTIFSKSDIKATNGDISVKLVDEKYCIQAKSSVGDVNINHSKMSQNSKKTIFCSSKCGDIAIS